MIKKKGKQLQPDLYKQLIEHLPIHIYWKDINFHYMYCNELQAKNAGLQSPEDLIGKSDYDILPECIASQIRQNDEKVVKTGKALLFEENFNSVHDVFLTQKIPLLNHENEIIGIAGISLDITARKKSEDAMRIDKEQAEFTLSNILDNLPGHVYWKDLDGVYRGCNNLQAKSAGFSRKSDFISKTDYELPWHEDADQLRESDLAVMQSQQALTREEFSQVANSKEVSIFLSKKAPLFDKNGVVIGILGISFDITERKKLEEDHRIAKEKAERGERAKTEFIANVTHDIRTPLTGIIGISEYLKDSLSSPDDREKIELINAGGTQLLGLLNDVLETLSVDTANEDQVLHKSFDLYALIEDLCELEKPAILSHQLDFHLSVDKKIPRYLVSDKMKLHRIILNLIGNSIKFTKEGSINLELKLLENKDGKARIEFSVRDTGIGIPIEAQSQVFDRFYKVSASYKGKFKGNGIGLHIVQKYTKLLGGEITFQSKEGEGTTFSFVLTLPIGEATDNREDEDYKALLKEEKRLIDSPKKSTNQLKIGQPDNKKPKILVIEDNAMALTTLLLLLSKFNVEAQEAMDAEIALEIIKKQRFDLIITDIGLPGISGDEMVVLVREYEQEQGISPQKIVALTGHADTGEFAKKCREAGISKVYQKPMKMTELKSLVEPLLLAKATQKNLEAKETVKPTAGGKLGIDLPDREEELFEISHYPLFDIQVGADIMGSEKIVREMMKDFKKDTLGEDLEVIKKSHERGDWEKIRSLAHKIKGGSCYGTVRLYYALLYMERYIKAGYRHCAEDLYKQMLRVIEDTVTYLENEK